MEKYNKLDISASIVKSTIGAVPAVGPVISEVITKLIPNQRIDRIQTLLEEIELRVKDIESNEVKQNLGKPEYVDLLEDGIFQTVRAVSNERIKYIAHLVSHGLTVEIKDCIRTKKLLSLLDSINDAEILFLIYYNRLDLHNNVDNYFEKHSSVLAPVGAHIGSSISEIEEESIQKSYKQHLVEVGLLQELYKKPRKDELPEFDFKTGRIKANSYEITALGRILLKYLGERTIYEQD